MVENHGAVQVLRLEKQETTPGEATSNCTRVSVLFSWVDAPVSHVFRVGMTLIELV
jgi:hypothetical protein